MYGDHFFTPILILLTAAAILSTVFYRLRIPALLAFILVGLALGPTGLGVITDVAQLSAIAELGLVFLLFVLGLEFSVSKLIAMRQVVFRLGGAQVALCSAAFFLAFYWWGMDWHTAIALAGGLALSSTAIVSRELMQLGQLHSRHGQIAIGVLLFQDLVAVVLLISVPLLAKAMVQPDTGTLIETMSLTDLQDIAITLSKSVGLLVLFFVFARYILPRMLSEVANTKSDELLVLSALVIVLVAGVATETIGLSMELGAFLAGMMLAETRFKHQLEADVRPFRDVLLGLFFISIGMLIDIQMLKEYWFRILYCGLALLAFKFVVISGVARLLGESWRSALPAGLALAQGGEFLFALLALGARESLVPPDIASFLLSICIVSMALTPVLLRHSGWLTDKLLKQFAVSAETVADDAFAIADSAQKNNHVIILGFGRVGQTVARFLRKLEIPYLALETDLVRITEACAAGEPVFYGDTMRADILKAAGIENAALLVISFDDARQAQHILHVCKLLNPSLPMLTRTRDDTHLAALLAAGASEVVPETLEASLMLVSHVLLMLNIPSLRIHEAIDEARRNRYKMLHGFYHGERVNLVGRAGVPNEIRHAVRLTENAFANGKTVAELKWPASALAQLNGASPLQEINRDGKVFAPEDFSQPLIAGDVVLLLGSMPVVDQCETYLLTGRK